MNDAEKLKEIDNIIRGYANLPGTDDLTEGVMAILTISAIQNVVRD